MILKPLLFLLLRVGWKWRAAPRGGHFKNDQILPFWPQISHILRHCRLFLMFSLQYICTIYQKNIGIVLKTFFLWPLGVGWKWHKKCVADNSKTANLPFLTPDFPYNQGLLVIFNDFTEIYMYTILEIHKNDLQYLFLLATEGRVKMARRAAPRRAARGTTESNGRR